jgi:hypothetical protein
MKGRRSTPRPTNGQAAQSSRSRAIYRSPNCPKATIAWRYRRQTPLTQYPHAAPPSSQSNSDSDQVPFLTWLPEKWFPVPTTPSHTNRRIKTNDFETIAERWKARLLFTAT